MRMIKPGVAASAAKSPDTRALRSEGVSKFFLLIKRDASARLEPTTATLSLVNALKNAPQLGSSVTVSWAFATPSLWSLLPNWMRGSIDSAVSSLLDPGLMNIAIPEVENPPHPSLAHLSPLSARISHSSCVRLGFASNVTMTVCKVTRGEAKIVLSSTTPKVPPPPLLRYESVKALSKRDKYLHGEQRIDPGFGSRSQSDIGRQESRLCIEA